MRLRLNRDENKIEILFGHEVLAEHPITEYTIWNSQGGSFRARRVKVSLGGGCYASIVWGRGTYSENHHLTGSQEFAEEPTTVEVWVLGPDEIAMTDEPQAYVPVGELGVLLDDARRWAEAEGFIEVLVDEDLPDDDFSPEDFD